MKIMSLARFLRIPQNLLRIDYVAKLPDALMEDHKTRLSQENTRR